MTLLGKMAFAADALVLGYGGRLLKCYRQEILGVKLGAVILGLLLAMIIPSFSYADGSWVADFYEQPVSSDVVGTQTLLHNLYTFKTATTTEPVQIGGAVFSFGEASTTIPAEKMHLNINCSLDGAWVPSSAAANNCPGWTYADTVNFPDERTGGLAFTALEDAVANQFVSFGPVSASASTSAIIPVGAVLAMHISYQGSFFPPEGIYLKGDGAATNKFLAHGSGEPYMLITGTTLDVCTSDCNSNVLFLPGVGGSRLYDGTDDATLWEPSLSSDTTQLYLNSDGSSTNQNIYTKDVVDEAYASLNIYKSFIQEMNDLKSTTTGTTSKIADWAAVPYDWRLSLDDILNGGTKTGEKISYIGTSTNPYVMSELLRMASSSRTGKVTIVAHSNGGLVAKALLIAHPELAQYIDKIIFVSVPQVGTPQGIAALLHGHEQGIPEDFPFLLTEQEARSFAQNAPVVYNLLPSADYFTSVEDPVVTFDSTTLPDWVSLYGDVVDSQSGFDNFLTDSYQRVAADNANITHPTDANDVLLDAATATHADLDAWTPPEDIEFIQIAGWGVPKTLKGIEYASTTKGLTLTASTTIDGDGTVVVPSALWTTSALPNVTNYWVNLKAYNGFVNRVLTGNLLPTDHKDILEVDGLLSFISDAIINNINSTYPFISSTVPNISPDDIRLRYELHSPLTLNLYDDQGRHTGVSTTTGQIEEEIPGTYYMELGDVKYLFTDASSTSHIVMNGFATSTFTFKVEQLEGDSVVATTTWKDIPTTPQTTVMLDTETDISTLSSMRLDSNSDGTVDFTIAPALNDEVTLQTLTLVKTVINDNGGTATTTDFQGKIDGMNVPWSVAQALPVGAHTASEATSSSYAAGSWGGDCAANGSITLTAGENKTCTITNNDIATGTGSISGKIFNDKNANGTRETGDNGLDEWLVTATGPVLSTTEANNGNYSFPNLPAGTYTITATDTPSTIENGHVQTTLPSPTRTVVNASNFQNVDIGFFENGVIKGKVFKDLNGNGTRETGENWLNGWTVVLHTPASTTLQVVTGDDGGTGEYEFPQVGPGTHTLTLTQQAGWIQTSTNPAPITLTSEQTVSNVRFGVKEE